MNLFAQNFPMDLLVLAALGVFVNREKIALHQILAAVAVIAASALLGFTL